MDETLTGIEDMHRCEVKPHLDNYVKLNHFLSGAFAVVVVGVGALFAVIDLKLSPVVENVKRNELRNARLESSLISSNKMTSDKLGQMIQGIDKLNNNFSNLKYIYATKEDLDKKVDKKEVDSRLLKSAYRNEK